MRDIDDVGGGNIHSSAQHRPSENNFFSRRKNVCAMILVRARARALATYTKNAAKKKQLFFSSFFFSLILSKIALKFVWPQTFQQCRESKALDFSFTFRGRRVAYNRLSKLQNWRPYENASRS